MNHLRFLILCLLLLYSSVVEHFASAITKRCTCQPAAIQPVAATCCPAFTWHRCYISVSLFSTAFLSFSPPPHVAAVLLDLLAGPPDPEAAALVSESEPELQGLPAYRLSIPELESLSPEVLASGDQPFCVLNNDDFPPLAPASIKMFLYCMYSGLPVDDCEVSCHMVMHRSRLLGRQVPGERCRQAKQSARQQLAELHSHCWQGMPEVSS